jgi:hypothetical protein
MSIYRKQESLKENNIETIKAGCPICHQDVKGDDIYLYYCKKCNILFKKSELILSKQHIESIMKDKIIKKYDEDKDALEIADKKIDLKKPKAILYKKSEKKMTYFVSKSSKMLHASNCPYGKNVKKQNRLYFKSIDDAKEFKKCRCII